MLAIIGVELLLQWENDLADMAHGKTPAP